MSNKIARHHFSMSKSRFAVRKAEGDFFKGEFGGLGIREIEATPENFKPLVDLVGEEWGWNHKEMNTNPEMLAKRMADNETRLFMLTDKGVDIGYTIITKPSPSIKQKFFRSANDVGVIEIENLGLFPNQEGNGRGGKFFEMMFERLFNDYDHVYWSMSSTNHPRLFNYYKNKMKMTLLGTDHVKDFRPKQKPKVA